MERSQRVVLNGKNVTSRGPQGSVLGQVLLIYVKDMPDSLNSFCKIFADDTKLYTTVEYKKDQIKL